MGVATPPLEVHSPGPCSLKSRIQLFVPYQLVILDLSMYARIRNLRMSRAFAVELNLSGGTRAAAATFPDAGSVYARCSSKAIKPTVTSPLSRTQTLPISRVAPHSEI